MIIIIIMTKVFLRTMYLFGFHGFHAFRHLNPIMLKDSVTKPRIYIDYLGQ